MTCQQRCWRLQQAVMLKPCFHSARQEHSKSSQAVASMPDTRLGPTLHVLAGLGCGPVDAVRRGQVVRMLGLHALAQLLAGRCQLAGDADRVGLTGVLGRACRGCTGIKVLERLLCSAQPACKQGERATQEDVHSIAVIAQQCRQKSLSGA